ncbi:MAG: hypothetical protein Q4D26_12155 [Clostridia bacterium]|nr:hypothetical protein [Clostridia bacterium]
MSNVTNVYIGNEHSYTIKRITIQCFEVYIHNRYTAEENLIGKTESYSAAEEIIEGRLKTNRAGSYAAAVRKGRKRRK